MDVRSGLTRVPVRYSKDRLILGALINSTIYIYEGGSAGAEDQFSASTGSCTFAVMGSSNCR